MSAPDRQVYVHANLTDTGLINTTVIPLGVTDIIRQGNRQQFTLVDLTAFQVWYGHIHGYLSAVVCAFGILANMANIAVLTRKNMITSTNAILLWLAVADLLTMMSYLPVSVHFYVLLDPDLKFPQTRSYNWIHFLLFHSSFSLVCHSIAIWLTICLAIFRYIYVCYPTHGGTLCTLKRAKIMILAVYLSTIGILITNYMTNGVATTKNGVYEIRETKLAIYNPIIVSMNSWIQAIVIKIIPCVLLTILTILLIMAMHKANKRRQMLKSQGRKDDSERAREHNRTTGMLLAIVVLFLITELPQGILAILFTIDDRFRLEVYLPLGDLFDAMALINNAVNFVLYCTMSRQFRETFVQVFCSCCPDTRPGWLKLSTFEHKNVNEATATTSLPNSSV